MTIDGVGRIIATPMYYENLACGETPLRIEKRFDLVGSHVAALCGQQHGGNNLKFLDHGLACSCPYVGYYGYGFPPPPVHAV
jgi:hypothetical protein